MTGRTSGSTALASPADGSEERIPPLAAAASTPATWHVLKLPILLARLNTTPAGLAGSEAVRRLDVHGPNELHAFERRSPWHTLLAQFKNVLILILLSATVLSGVMGHALEAIVIVVIVLFAVFLGFIQEYRAERALEALRKMAAPLAHVLRDGSEVAIAARELVPGDIIFLRAGDRVPADARIVRAIGLAIEEAALTGESVPAEKNEAPLGDPRLPIGDRKNMAYAGTLVAYGRGQAVVVATGMETEFGHISWLVQTVESGRTPLQENLDKLGATLGKAALVVVALIVVLGLWRGLPPLEMFIFGIALAVAVVPEALPAVVTISLAIGVRRMVKRNALVRRLPVVETLGTTSVICSDKTGTLTKNEMTVRRLVAGCESFVVSGVGYEPTGAFHRASGQAVPTGGMTELLRAGVLASDARLVFHEDRWRVEGDPTEGALIVAAAKAGLDQAELNEQQPRTHEIAFTSERRRMTTLHAAAGRTTAYSKGAADVVVADCAWELRDGAEVPLTDMDRDRIYAEERGMAAEGLRVLAIARKREAGPEEAERRMTLLGLVGIIDPPRTEAKTAVRTCEDAGITPVMITGDHPLTARSVAAELGLLKGRVVSGRDLESMSDADLEREIANISVYARVSPADKLRIVGAWQRRGEVVAMTGDGVNDAPALKKADGGIAMGITGTDVSKEASGMTLLDDNFASIVAAVEEGRIVFGNIKKYLTYLLSSNVGEIVLMAVPVVETVKWIQRRGWLGQLAS